MRDPLAALAAPFFAIVDVALAEPGAAVASVSVLLAVVVVLVAFA